MKLTRESEYGLRALVFLAAQPLGTVQRVSEIAQAQEIPQSFLAKIFQKFAQYDLVRSYRGKQRGYALAKSPQAIRLKDILEALEGPGLTERCIFWSERCATDNSCLLHAWWAEIRPGIVEMLQQTTLAEVAEGRPVAGLSL